MAWLRYYALFDGSACLDVLSSMSDIENHEVDPRLSTVLALAHALHLDLGVLNVLPAPSRRRARKISH